MLPVSLDCPFLIALPVFSYVCFNDNNIPDYLIFVLLNSPSSIKEANCPALTMIIVSCGNQTGTYHCPLDINMLKPE